MYKDKVKGVLSKVSSNKLTVDAAMKKLNLLPFEDLGYAKLDHHRALRKGYPEVVFCQNKTIDQVVEILEKLAANNSSVIGTKATPEMFAEVKKKIKNAKYNEVSKTIVITDSKKQSSGKILVITAGTSDIAVAEEAATVAEAMGNKVERLYDVGVAGLHRLLANKEKVGEANVLIVVAGMDGALPSVVSGMFDKPLIAVPTSVGYGASFKGVAPLLTMLNACSPGIVVVNIDNGFGAGYFASLINK